MSRNPRNKTKPRQVKSCKSNTDSRPWIVFLNNHCFRPLTCILGLDGEDSDGDLFETPIDCDDSDPDINPAATEICNDGKDNDCNGYTDAADPACEGFHDIDSA